MGCYIERVVCEREVPHDAKELIPDPAMRRRMSRVVKIGVMTAVECMGGVEHIDRLDTLVTATGWGCLADSERFLRTLIVEREQLLNPTPFIQSTFNTVGGQVALLRHNHCYNVTYVHRGHSFEDALLDARLRMLDGDGKEVLVGAFDEQTPSQHRIMERMGLFRRVQDGEGAVFVTCTTTQRDGVVAELTTLDFPTEPLDEASCRARYATTDRTALVWNDYAEAGCYPTASAHAFARAVRMLSAEVPEVVAYHSYMGSTPTVIVVRWVGSLV